jgi:hypothetical protein
MKKRTSDRQIPDDAHVDEPADDRNLVVLSAPDELPPVLAGHQTPEIRARAESLYAGVAELFERWVARRPSPHTQRAHRRDVLSFVDFLGLPWPQEAFRLLLASVAGVHSWRDSMMAETKAPQDPQPPHLLALELLHIWPAPPPSCGSRSTSPIRPTPNSSPGNHLTRSKARGR